MSAGTAKMICSECGIEMNHHADKLVDPISPKEALQVDPALGGLIEEAHCCPDCGKSVPRRVP